MHHQPQFLTTPDGFQIYSQSWQPDAPKASIFLVHGYAEHSGRYAAIAQHLAHQGFAVYALDLRHHGRSQGQRGLIQQFDQFQLDLATCWQTIPKNQPIFLLSHSMGSIAALMFALKNQSALAGLITSATILAIDQDVSELRIQTVTQVSAFLPQLPVARIDSHTLSHDSNIVQAYNTDPLVYHKALPAKTAVELFRAVRQVRTQLSRLSLPILILHGTADRLAPMQGSQILHDSISSTDKSLQLYEHLYHEVLNEPEQDSVLADITAWLKTRLLTLTNPATVNLGDF
jgi:acylglycerol lipase